MGHSLLGAKFEIFAKSSTESKLSNFGMWKYLQASYKTWKTGKDCSFEILLWVFIIGVMGFFFRGGQTWSEVCLNFV